MPIVTYAENFAHFVPLRCEQGDQIGRIFDQWVILDLG
jgi:hypothetical protein